MTVVGMLLLTIKMSYLLLFLVSLISIDLAQPFLIEF